MQLTLNLSLGMLAGFTAAVVGAATLLLVLWQAPRRRENQALVAFMASVLLWGVAGFGLSLTISLGIDADFWFLAIPCAMALNAICTFWIAAQFAGRTGRPQIVLALSLGVTALVLGTPALFSSQMIVLHSVTADGLYVYGLTPLAAPFIALFMAYYVGALVLIIRDRRGPAGRLLVPCALAAATILVNLVPALGASSVDLVAATVASVLFARLILDEHLFGPLKRLNRELAESNAQLTALSGRLAASAEDLGHARDAAESANRAKSAFLATMSHELRTPLTVILGLSELLGYEVAALRSPTIADDVSKIHIAGTHLLTLINEILDIAKIESGSMTLRDEPVNLRELVAELVGLAEPLAQHQGNRLDVRYEAAIVEIEADPLRLRQVLMNLLSNAAKFTEGGMITLSVRGPAGDPGTLAIEVCDSGIGLSQEQIARLFVPFSQVDSSATRRHNGTGLGLAISRQLCRLMGGELTVTSQPGAGSCFLVRLPYRAASVPAESGIYAATSRTNGTV